MGYTKKPSSDRYSSILGIQNRMKEMEVGEVLLISWEGSPEQMSYTKWLIYDWLKHENLKDAYRLRSVPGGFEIWRLDTTPAPYKIEKKRAPLGHLDSLFQELLGLETEEKVKEALALYKITEGDRKILELRWKEVME